MIPKPKQNARETTKKSLNQDLTPLDKATVLVLVEKKVHRKPCMISQQAIGSGCAKYRRSNKISPRPYANTRVKHITQLGVINHWGEYEEKHWYQVTPEYRDIFFKIEELAKQIAFEAVSALHSQSIDSIENLTLLLTNLLTVLIRPKKVPHKREQRSRSSSYKRYFDSYFPQKFPDTTAYPLTNSAKQLNMLIQKYGVPFVPDIDLGKELNAYFWEEIDEWRSERDAFDGRLLGGSVKIC